MLPNPLVPGFNPDPSVVRADGAYYLVTSTFEYLPGIPVYRSTDLVSWTQIGNVATRPEQVGVAGAPTGGGVWAPTIRYRDGVFHVIVTIAMSPRGCVVFTATDPAGPWSDGTTIEGVGTPEKLHPMQKAFMENHALQCGFCTPGMVMAATSFIRENPNPSEQDVRIGLEGNLCRCTGYHNIVKAVLAAAEGASK